MLIKAPLLNFLGSGRNIVQVLDYVLKYATQIILNINQSTLLFNDKYLIVNLLLQ